MGPTHSKAKHIGSRRECKHIYLQYKVLSDPQHIIVIMVHVHFVLVLQAPSVITYSLTRVLGYSLVSWKQRWWNTQTLLMPNMSISQLFSCNFNIMWHIIYTHITWIKVLLFNFYRFPIPISNQHAATRPFQLVPEWWMLLENRWRSGASHSLGGYQGKAQTLCRNAWVKGQPAGDMYGDRPLDVKYHTSI